MTCPKSVIMLSMGKPTTALNGWTQRHRDYYWSDEGKQKRRAANLYAKSVENKEAGSARSKALRDKRRQEAIDMLGGPKCVRCGYDADVRALNIDHINGGGKKEVSEFGFNLYKMYCYILGLGESAARMLYQVLCANCNRIKMFERNEWGRGRAIKKYREMSQ